MSFEPYNFVELMIFEKQAGNLIIQYYSIQSVDSIISPEKHFQLTFLPEPAVFNGPIDFTTMSYKKNDFSEIFCLN